MDIQLIDVHRNHDADTRALASRVDAAVNAAIEDNGTLRWVVLQHSLTAHGIHLDIPAMNRLRRAVLIADRWVLRAALFLVASSGANTLPRLTRAVDHFEAIGNERWAAQTSQLLEVARLLAPTSQHADV